MAGELARLFDAIPLVVSAAQRDVLFPSPTPNQRIYDASRDVIQRFDAGWIDGPGASSGPPFVITGAAVDQTLRFDGTNWVNTGVLKTTTAGIVVTGTMSFTQAPLPYRAFQVESDTILSGHVNQTSVFAGATIGSDGTGFGRAVAARIQTAVASFTIAEAAGVYIFDAAKGAGSTITTQYGLYIVSQTSGGTNYAIYTNAGPVRFGDTNLVQLGTVATDIKLRNDSVTWNNGAVSFKGWYLNITNTASAAGSRIIDLQVGLADRFWVDVAGGARVGTLGVGVTPTAGVAAAVGAAITAVTGFGLGLSFNSSLTAAANNDILAAVYSNPAWVPGSFTGLTTAVFYAVTNSTAVTGTKYGLFIGNLSGGTVDNFAIHTGTGFVRHGDTHQVQLGTITAAKRLRDDTVTWNDGASIFNCWHLQVANTASNPTSQFLVLRQASQVHFQVGTPFAANSPLVIIQNTTINNQALLALNGALASTGSTIMFDVGTTSSGISDTHIGMRLTNDAGTVFNVTVKRGITGLFGGSDLGAGVRIGGGNNSTFDSGQLGPTALVVGALFPTTATTSHTLVDVGGAGATGTYTVTTVTGIKITTYIKAANETITNWYGLRIEAPPTATNKWAIRTHDGEWFKDSITHSVVLGNAALATTATDGFLYIPSCAGTPTGTPTTKTGTIPLVYDSTNHILYAYSGGSWRTH